MPRRRRRKVALLVETSNTYARDLLHGLRAWMREHESWVIRFSEQSRGAAAPLWLRRWDGDGIIARVESADIAADLKSTGLPVVDVSAALPELAFPRVSTDSEAVTRLAVAHLSERGLRHFGYCGDLRFLWSKRREEFFRAQLAARGHACDVFVPPAGRARLTDEAEVRAMAQWLRSLPKPTGVLACYDIRGQQVLEACQLAGLRVPDDIAVIGVHNDELLCDLCDPPLSSVIPNARRAGYVAANLLARMMNGKPVTLETHVVEPLGVAARQSTDLVAVDDPKVSAAVRFICEHTAQRITVGDVLRVVPMARTLLERKFRQYLGCTVHERIERSRLEYVKALLLETDLAIGAIAERAGFEHPEYMSVAFRRWSGLPPRTYRARHRLAIIRR